MHVVGSEVAADDARFAVARETLRSSTHFVTREQVRRRALTRLSLSLSRRLMLLLIGLAAAELLYRSTPGLPPREIISVFAPAGNQRKRLSVTVSSRFENAYFLSLLLARAKLPSAS